MQVGTQEIHTKDKKYIDISSPLEYFLWRFRTSAFSFHSDSKIYNEDKKYYSSANSPFYIKMIKYIESYFLN